MADSGDEHERVVEVRFEEDGFLWLLNRCLLHRVGYAFGVNPTTPDECVLLGDGSEQWVFAPDPEIDAREHAVRALLGDSAVDTLLANAGPETQDPVPHARSNPVDRLKLQVRQDEPECVLRQWRWRIVDDHGQVVTQSGVLERFFQRSSAVRAGLRRLHELQDRGNGLGWEDVDPANPAVAAG